MKRTWCWALATVALVAACVLGTAVGRADIKHPSADRVELRGATSMVDFAQRSAEGFMTEHPESIVVVSGGGPRRGLKSLLVGTTDVALFTGEIPDELAKVAKDKKVTLTRKDVYRDAIVVVVHPKNPLADLSLAQVRDIFRGEITNWKALGGKDGPIVVVNLDSSTGAFETFKRQVMGDGLVVTPKAITVEYPDFDKQIVENAIGYIGKRQNNFKAISLDGIDATPELIAAGKYPVQRHLSVVYRNDAPPAVGKFVDYMLAPDKGQAIVRAQGAVPVN